MFSHNLKTFFRNFIKNPFYSIINLLGLSVGLSATIIAVLYITNETSYNKFHKDYEKIYRIGAGIKNESFEISTPNTLPDIAPLLMDKVPEIESATRFVRWYDNSIVKVGNDQFPNVSAVISDHELLNVFSFELLRGERSSFLRAPDKIAITESLATKLFGDTDPMHQIIYFEKEPKEVAWILKDPPHNSQIKFELLANFEFKKPFYEYLRLDVFTFFKLKQPMNKDIREKIQKVSDKHLLDVFEGWATSISSPIQPLKEIYLHSNLEREIGRRGNIKTLYIFGFLAMTILLIAVVNYINLLTSRSEYRGKEVGIKKVAGATKHRLRSQFLSESVATTFIALFIGFVIAEFFVYMINRNMNLNLSVFGQSTPLLIISFILVSVLIGIFSGAYPAFVLSRFQPAKVIKGIFETGGKANFLKIGLVIIQFSISTILIITILTFNAQIKYLKNQPLGFNKENLLVLSGVTDKMAANYESIRTQLLSHPNIDAVAGSQSIPGWGRSGQSIRRENQNNKQAIPIQENRVQDYYASTMEFEFVDGRDFTESFNDNESIIINEVTAKKLNLDNPVGEKVVVQQGLVTIVGVIKDFHYFSLKSTIEPLYLSNYAGSERINNISMRLNPNDLSNTIDYIREVVREYDPDYFWNHFFIDQMFDGMYRSEENLFNLVFFGSGIAFFLSVLGLFALTSYTILKKYKEVGIRKTFGASVQTIIFHLNSKILRWVLLTNIIAWPAGYFLMNNWLQNYPYKIAISWSFFIIAAIISLLVAFLTITYQSVKAATMNPTDALRYE